MRIDTNRVLLIDDTEITGQILGKDSVAIVTPVEPENPNSHLEPVAAFNGPTAMEDAELFVFYATGGHLVPGTVSTEIDTVSDWKSDFGMLGDISVGAAEGVDIGAVLQSALGKHGRVVNITSLGINPTENGLDISGAEAIPAALAEAIFGKSQGAEIAAAQKAFQAFGEANKALEAEGYNEIESLALWDATKTYRAGETVFYKGAVFGAPAAMDAGIAPNPEANEPWVRVQLMAVCNDPTDHDCKAGDARAKLEALAAEEAALNTPAAETAPTDASLN